MDDYEGESQFKSSKFADRKSKPSTTLTTPKKAFPNPQHFRSLESSREREANDESKPSSKVIQFSPDRLNTIAPLPEEVRGSKLTIDLPNPMRIHQNLSI